VIKAEFSASLLSLQCHMILQKSLQYDDLLLKKRLWLLSMLKTVQKNSIYLK